MFELPLIIHITKSIIYLLYVLILKTTLPQKFSSLSLVLIINKQRINI